MILGPIGHSIVHNYAYLNMPNHIHSYCNKNLKCPRALPCLRHLTCERVKMREIII